MERNVLSARLYIAYACYIYEIAGRTLMTFVNVVYPAQTFSAHI
jgi:hypothetical protein